MAPSGDPNQAAKDFVKSIRNGQTPLSVNTIPGTTGGYVEQIAPDSYITMRPAGAGRPRTSGDTATVEINDPAVKALNGGDPLKLKFPKKK